jgi:hypothetical protein
MALPKIFAHTQRRRSPIYRETQKDGAFCAVVNGGADALRQSGRRG